MLLGSFPKLVMRPFRPAIESRPRALLVKDAAGVGDLRPVSSRRWQAVAVENGCGIQAFG
jgi:hypothetical protein